MPALRSRQNRPNILLIMTDQHRADMMSCAGSSQVPTPNIDRIAARGVRFAHAYCPYPVCVASRMSMLTGLYSHTTGAVNNSDRLDWRYRTLAHHFADHGYLTGLIGKMHFGDAHKHGFAYYLSINDWLMALGPKARHYANEIANHPLGENFYRTVDDDGAGLPDVSGIWGTPGPWVGHVERWDFKSMASNLEAEDHLDAFIARETAKFMRQYRDQPFFLIASFMKPHTPLFAPREWAERYPVDKAVLPDPGPVASYPEHIRKRIAGFLKRDEWLRKAHFAGYCGNLAFADVCVGQTLDALEELDLADNTIVVYTSDHGEMHGDHGLFQKFCLFEPSVRVPLIAAWRGHIAEGTVAEALTEQIGLYPTLCELAGFGQPRHTAVAGWMEPDSGFGAPASLDARSFAEIVLDPALPGPDAAFSEFALRSGVCSYMVRTKLWKYIHNDGGELDELYDCQGDPGEYRNLAIDPARAGIVNEMRERLLGWFDPARNRFKPRREG
ncbi:MAG: Arylsulfatase [candidate division BRC1 bacterium ADurb.BinA364]|nr:MAG: Arylsulfatase [candidate division BRC1 bacterium ADurb.BinA364]